MSRRKDTFGAYTRSSKTHEEKHWLGGIAKALHLGLYQKDNKRLEDEVYGLKLAKPKGGKQGMDLFIEPCMSTQAPFWFGVTFEHWVIGPNGLGTKKNKHMAISRCGIIKFYEDWEIACGRLPQTCSRCEPSAHSKDVFAELPPQDVSRIQTFWQEHEMATAIDERSNLKGKEANDAWDKEGRPLLESVIEKTPYRKHFGWKCFIRNCMAKSHAVSSGHRIRVRAIHKSEKRIEIVLQPADCHYEFECDLTTGRTDVDFMTVAEAVSMAAKFVTPVEEAKPAKRAVAAAASENGDGNGHVNIIDLVKLQKLQSNLEKVMRIGKDVNEMAGMKMVAQEKVRQAMAKATECYEKLDTLSRKREEQAKLHKVHVDRVEELRMKLRNETATMEEFHKNLVATSQQEDLAKAEYEPFRDAAEQARAELRELEAIETENLKSVGDAAGLQALLKALGNIG